MPDFRPALGSTAEVLVARDGVLGRLRLNRPRAINALTRDMLSALGTQLSRWEDDDDVRAVWLDGAGERGLCAGGDVLAVRHAALADPVAAVDFWAQEYAVDAQIATYPKPVVVLMDGIVMGGGLGLAAYADLRLVTPRSVVAMPETGIGFFPDVGSLYLLSRAPGELGTHLALTGASIDGADAIAVGLADALVDVSAVDHIVDGLAQGARPDPGVGARTPPSRLRGQRSWIDTCYQGKDPARILARLRSHPDPEARGAGEVVASRSPLSVAVTLEALRRAATLETVEDVLDQDLRLGERFLAHSDFVEGVRAQLVDRDRRPRWRHETLATVSRDDVLSMFANA